MGGDYDYNAIVSNRIIPFHNNALYIIKPSTLWHCGLVLKNVEYQIIVCIVYGYPIIIIQHLFLRHVSSHCGHSEAHYSLKHLHIINNIMIKTPTVILHDKI